MKGTIFYKVLSAIMAFAMIFGVCSTTISATTAGIADNDIDGAKEKPELNYVSLGASNVNGYGMHGYLEEEVYEHPLLKENANIYGYKQDTPGSYPVLIKDALSSKYTVNLSQMAISSMRAEEVRFLLDDSYKGDAYTDWRFCDVEGYDKRNSQNWFKLAGELEWAAQGNTGTPTYEQAVDALKAAYRDAIKNADLITVDIGVNNFGVYASNQIVSNMYENDLNTIDPELAAKYAEGKAYVLDLIAEYAADITIPTETLEHLADTMAYALVGFCLSFDAVMEQIYTLNPDATVVVVSIQNLMDGLYAQLPGIDAKIPFGDLFGALVNAANVYTAVVSDYAGEYLYADVREDGHVEFFSDELLGYNGDPSTLSQDMKDCFDVYDNDLYIKTRVQQLLATELYKAGLLDVSAVPAGYDVVGNLEHFALAYQLDLLTIPALGVTLEQFFAAGATGQLDGTPAADYYAMYEVALTAAYDVMAEIFQDGLKLDTLDASTFGQSFGPVEDQLLGSFFEVLEAAVNASLEDPSFSFELEDYYPNGIYNAIAENTGVSVGFVNTVAALGIRTGIGNSFFGHPNGNGQVELADAILETLENGTTGKDVAIKEVIVAIEDLIAFVIEYHDDAYAYAYDELYNAGYIAAAQKALLDAKAEVENLQAALVSMEVDARLEETVKILDAELALIIVTIDDLYTLLDHSELTAETWALLGELCDKLARHLDNVELLVVELYGVAANEVIAIYNKVVAQLEIAVDAVKQVVTEYINKVTDFYLYIVENGQAIFEEFVNEVVKVIGYYSHEAAKACYDWLYNNPEKVIAFLAENGDDIINFIVEYGKPAFAVIGYIAQNYGEDILNFVFDNADVIIPAFVEWYNIHGEYVWDLIAVYVEAVIEIYNLDELAWEAIHKAYDEAIKYLGEILNNIVNGKYDYEDLLDAIEKIEQIIGNIDDALGGALSAIVSELKDMINQLTDKVAAEIIAKLEELENALLEILKNVADEIKESVYAELDALKEMLVNFGEYTKAEILAQLARLEDVLKAAAKELGEYVYDEAIKYIDKATKVEYTPEEDSYYVAVNGGYADYAELVAEALGITDIDYTVWGDIDYDALAAADLITIGFDENEFSAFAVEQMLAYVKNYVDVDVRNSVNDYADDVFEKLYGIPAITNRQDEVVAYINDFVDQVVNYELISDKELTDMDWAKIVGAENVEYVNAILAKLRTELVASGMVENYVVSVPVVDYIYAMYPEIETEVVFKSEVENRLGDSVVYTIEIPVADSIMFAVEAYLYSFLQFSVEYNNVVEYVNENNSDATVVLLGAYNAFCVEFAMGDVVIDLSEVYSYVAKVASIQPFVYALIDENIGYADIEDAQTWFEYYVEEGMAGNTIADFLMFYLMDNTCTDVSPAGSEYISEQILNAIVIVTDEEEVCNHEYDNACDEYCNICGEYREAAGHNFEIWWIIKPATTTEEGLRVSNCTECGFEKEIVIPVLAPVVPDEPINPDNPDDPDDPDDPDEPTNPDTPSQPTNPDQGDKDDEDDKDEDEKKGLSGGAIAGIVVGATAVAGAGGFAAYWFLVKHSTFAALGTAIAAIFSKETFAAIGAAIVGFFKKIGKFFKK